jgi:hypothetical protein
MVIILLFALTISLSQCAFAADTFSSSQINQASTNVKNFVDKNDRLPNYVTISGKQVSMPQFLYLMTSNVQNLKNGKKVSVTSKSVQAPTSSTENIKIGNVQKASYLTISQNIKNTISSTGKAPTSVKTSIGTMGYKNIVYTYAKALNFYRINNRLPNYVTVNPFPDKLGWTSVSYTYHHQTTGYTCGPSALKMAFSHYGINESEGWFTTKAGSNKNTGTSQNGMIAAIKAVNAKYGTKFSTNTESFTGWNKIQAYLAKGAPVIVRCLSWQDVGGSHYVVITGINLQTGKVRLGDPSYQGGSKWSPNSTGVKVHEVTMQDLQNRLNWIINNKGISSPLIPIVKN